MNDVDSKSDDSEDEDYNPEEDLKAQKAKEAAEKKAAARAAGPLGFAPNPSETKTKPSDRWRRGPAEEETKPLVGAEAVRKRKMDAMWAELNGSSAAPALEKQRPKKKRKAGKKKNSKQKKEKMLAALLGGGVLVGDLSKKKKGGIDFKMPSVVIRKSKPGQKLSVGKIEVSETVKFAGQTISVTKILTAGTKEAAEHERQQEAKKHTTNLDNVLASITKPTTISVTTKTSKDWDKFKADQGIEDELAQATKDGYLAKKDFLNRVDSRQFDIEKADRDRKRAQKG